MEFISAEGITIFIVQGAIIAYLIREKVASVQKAVVEKREKTTLWGFLTRAILLLTKAKLPSRKDHEDAEKLIEEIKEKQKELAQ